MYILFHLLLTIPLPTHTHLHYSYNEMHWDGDVIVVMNDVRVSPPYTENSCTGSTQLIDRIMKKVCCIVTITVNVYILRERGGERGRKRGGKKQWGERGGRVGERGK